MVPNESEADRIYREWMSGSAGGEAVERGRAVERERVAVILSRRSAWAIAAAASPADLFVRTAARSPRNRQLALKAMTGAGEL